eukprot:GDKJ01058426.1.p1 GENE.GDKJ01058426.1~~GDKJ01058426.1.p1  ORF type:complete len:367 (+),score=34.37 GDKJ01058426.1:48-1148(+)
MSATVVAKLLPVVFILAVIITIYVLYTFKHLQPLLQLHVDPSDRDPVLYSRGLRDAIIFNILSLLVGTCFARSVLTNPGSIPDIPEWHCSAECPNTQGPPVPTFELKDNGERRTCKFCHKFKPDRAHHCRVCQTCVLKMDHHCPWIHNCVGFHNHKFFFLLLLYSVCSCWFVSVTVYDTVKRNMHEMETPFGDLFSVMFCETISTLLGLVITAFFAFHCGLAWYGITTLEFCERKRTPASGNSRYDEKSLTINLREILGPNILLWPFPIHSTVGDGLSFVQFGNLKDPRNLPYHAKGEMRARSLGKDEGEEMDEREYFGGNNSGSDSLKNYGGTGPANRVDQISGAFGGTSKHFSDQDSEKSRLIV